MFSDFDYSILDDPEFKEDSVREELIVPLIKELGYSASGENKVIRSRQLKHPFISIGAERRKISIIPDYLFLSKDKAVWILDAKSPSEEILKSKHCEQAYSYAIHPEVRAKYYALCNGKEFLLFYISQFEPLMHFEMEKINDNLHNLRKILHPDILARREVVEYKPDCGLYFLKSGKKPGFLYILYMVHTNTISQVSTDKYTTSTVVTYGEQEFLVSFDFDSTALSHLLEILPVKQAEEVRFALSNQPFQIHKEKEEFLFGIVSELGNKIYENNEEQYVPFIVKEFIPYAK